MRSALLTRLDALCCGRGISSLLQMARTWRMEPCGLVCLSWSQRTVAVQHLGFSAPFLQRAPGTQISTCRWLPPLCGAVTLWSSSHSWSIIAWDERFQDTVLYPPKTVFLKKVFHKSIVWSECSVLNTKKRPFLTHFNMHSINVHDDDDDGGDDGDGNDGGEDDEDGDWAGEGGRDGCTEGTRLNNILAPKAASGTKEDPAFIPSITDQPTVGCFCEEANGAAIWFWLHRSETQRCPDCGLHYTLVAQQLARCAFALAYSKCATKFLLSNKTPFALAPSPIKKKKKRRKEGESREVKMGRKEYAKEGGKKELTLIIRHFN
ncbi:hypothetical protein HPG69_013739 [Diceros bicornis minor]|uniref:Cytochrome c oxidase subunit 5B, mitochondrial n=1 Tax=Diceros bicornis minor TaxID=77932 RepID=A0A7J7FFD9_DICBM|nr:hypothetical protein HPG69_013739 [Diceros bicornis minor]